LLKRLQKVSKSDGKRGALLFITVGSKYVSCCNGELSVDEIIVFNPYFGNFEGSAKLL